MPPYFVVRRPRNGDANLSCPQAGDERTRMRKTASLRRSCSARGRGDESLRRDVLPSAANRHGCGNFAGLEVSRRGVLQRRPPTSGARCRTGSTRSPSATPRRRRARRTWVRRRLRSVSEESPDSDSPFERGRSELAGFRRRRALVAGSQNAPRRHRTWRRRGSAHRLGSWSDLGSSWDSWRLRRFS